MRSPGGGPPAAVLADLDRPEDARLARLLAFFREGEPAVSAEVQPAIDPLTVEDLIEAGVVEADGSDRRALIKLTSLGGLVLAGDTRRAWGRSDFVTGLSPPGRTVAYATVRRKVATALDVGTGSGVQALLAARHADRVVGVDVNPHALWFARLNQRLNGLANVTWLEGDWFEPAGRKRFDLVVANPPVTISPDNTVIARDSAIGGAALSRQVVRESAAHLADGGFATVLCNWPHSDRDWDTAPREWVAGLPCDAVVLNFGSEDPLAYAMNNVIDRPGLDPDETAATIKRWTDHYRSRGIKHIALGVVVLRHRDHGSPWIQAFQAEGAPSGPAGDQLERLFAGGEFLASRSGGDLLRDLLSARWRLVEGHRMEQTLTHENGAYTTGDAMLRLEPGLRLPAQVDSRLVPLIAACDGRRSLADLLRGTTVVELFMSTMKDLIARGYVVADGWPGVDSGEVAKG
jgi:methyltransferase family protein